MADAGMAAPLTARPAPRAAEPALTRRASLNAVQSLLDYTAKLGVGLVITPILVSGLGRTLFGVWEMLSRLVSYMTAADGRPTDALRLLVAREQERGDEGRRRRYVGGALVVWVLFVPLVLAVGAVLVWIAPALTKVAPAQRGGVRLATAFLVASFLAATLAAVPEAVLRGSNMGYKRMGLQAGLSIAGGALAALAVAAGLGLAGLGAVQVGVALLTGVVFWVMVRRYVPWFGAARPARTDVRAVLGTSVWLAVGDVVAKVLLASDVVILGLVRSPAAVTPYVLTGYATRTALGLFYFTVGAAMPGMGAVIGAGEYARAGRLRREILALTWLFATALGATILAWNPSFLGLWVGRSLYSGGWVNLLIVLLTAQTAFIRSDSYIIDAALRPRARVAVGAVSAAVTIGLATLLAARWGVAGLCAGMLAGRAVQSAAYPLLASDALREGRRLATRAAVRPFAVMVLLFLAGTLAGRVLAPTSWLVWAPGVTLTFAAVLLVALAAGLDQDSRRAIVARARTVVGGFRG